MPARNHRASFSEQMGNAFIKDVPHYEFPGTKSKEPVTNARNFVKEHGIQAPAVLQVVRSEHTTDEFFWAHDGMYSLSFVYKNWTCFPHLTELRDKARKEKRMHEYEPLIPENRRYLPIRNFYYA